MTVEVGFFKDKISLDEIAERLAEKGSKEGLGALVIFMGFVKGRVDEHVVYELIYEAHKEYALEKLREIGEWGIEALGAKEVVILHRLGAAKPGEPTIYVAVVAEEREKAFQAAREILERVKHEAPIFKLERRDDGDYWILGDRRRVPRRGYGS